MNLDRLSLGEKILGVSGLAIFLLSFAGFWIKAEGGGVTVRGNAWDGYGFLLKLGILLALAGAALVIARAANANVSIPWANAYRAIAGATLALFVIQLVIGPEEFPGIEISRGLGLFVGTLLAAAMAAGAWMHAEAPVTSTDPAPA